MARTLALRYDGDQAYRVVHPSGKVLRVFWVKKTLSVLDKKQDEIKLEDIPPGFDVPMICEVLEERKHRKRVFSPFPSPAYVLLIYDEQDCKVSVGIH